MDPSSKCPPVPDSSGVTPRSCTQQLTERDGMGTALRLSKQGMRGVNPQSSGSPAGLTIDYKGKPDAGKREVWKEQSMGRRQ